MDLIASLNLKPHPEGGYYHEYYKATDIAHTLRGMQYTATSMWFLLTMGDVLNFHKLENDEIWYWHEGGAALIHMIRADGSYECVRVGPPPHGSTYVCVIEAGTWYGVELEGTHVLLSAMVAPGFDFEDFTVADRDELQIAYPEHEDLIERLSY